jgi:pyrimidine operon attenuation protein/uracil phosphoribosyltransferase
MEDGKLIISDIRFNLIIRRLSHHILENHVHLSDLCLIGIQEKGVLLAERIRSEMNKIHDNPTFSFGKLDITFYRDDFRRRDVPIKAASTEMDFLVEDKNVILVDDVLYTGRTVQAAMTALQDYGRPRRVEMLCMVNRRFNRHLPITANYEGMAVDALEDAYVRVEWKEKEGTDRVILFSGQKPQE